MDLILQDEHLLKIDDYRKIVFYTAEKDYFIAEKKYTKALKSLDLYEKYNRDASIEIKINQYKEKAGVYKELGNYKKSQAYFQRYTQLKDSVFNSANTQSFLFHQTEFETELKEQEIQTKTAELGLEKQKRQKQFYFLGSIIAGLVLISILFFIYRSRKQILLEKRLKDKYTEDLLTETEREKKRISINLHDDVGQNLMLIKNQISLSENTKINEIVEDVIVSVRTISQNLHPIQLDQLGLTGALQNILSNTHEMSNVFVNHNIENIDGLLPKNLEVHLYRTVQELLNNVVKHSEAEALKVDIIKKESHIEATIKDNGRGFDFTEEFQKIGSLGLKTIKERVRMMGGSIIFDTINEVGTEVKITIPHH